MLHQTRTSRVFIIHLILVISIVVLTMLMTLKGSLFASSVEQSIMGMSGFYQDVTDEVGFTIRYYHLKNATIVAESFGYSIDDYYLDIDNNGIPEILCNCVYGGDGHRELYVYKIQDDMVMQGTVDYEKLELPGFDYWGANALQTEYDPDTSSIRVYYSTDFHEELKETYTDFDTLHFILWDPTPAASIYTGGDKA